MDHLHSPILITGAARSGTSMVAGSINLSGAWGGKMSGPNKNNRKGMFENVEIRNDIIKPFLRSMGYDPMGQKPLPNIKDFYSVPNEAAIELRGSVLQVIHAQGYRSGPWMYKGAKMCLIWPIWQAAFPNARWVIVRRNAEDIVSSCLRTAFMRAYTSRSGWLYWVAEHEARFEEMVRAKLNVEELWPQRMISGDFTGAENLINKLQLDWKFNEVRAFVEPKLWGKGSNNGRQSN